MSSLERLGLHNYLANDFYNNLIYNKNKLHYYLGRVQPAADDESPEVYTYAFNNDIAIRENMLYINKVYGNDICLAVARHDWVEGEIFDQWDHTLDLSNSAYYVVNSSHNVYKCLCNNNGSASTVEPTERKLDGVIKTSDGYIWKYMYNIPNIKWKKFANSNYIPVQRANTDSFYNNGSIDSAVVLKGGSGYKSAATLKTTVNRITTPRIGDVDFKCTTSVSADTGSISQIKIIKNGTGYYVPRIYAKEGAGAAFKLNFEAIDATAGNYKIKSVDIIAAGYGYRETPATASGIDYIKLKIEGRHTSGISADIGLVTSDGEITNAVVLREGTMYNIDKFTYTASVEQGSGFSALAGVDDDGTVTSYTIENTGSGYDSDATKLVIGEPDIQPICTFEFNAAVRGKASLKSVTIEDAGNIRFTQDQVSIELLYPGSNKPSEAAKLTASVDENGELTAINVVSGGVGYQVGDDYNNRYRIVCTRLDSDVTGMNFDASGTFESGGRIIGMTINDGGTGYKIKATLHNSGVSGKGKFNNNPSAIVEANVGTTEGIEGTIQQIAVIDPGIEYTPDSEVRIVVDGDGDDDNPCQLTPVLEDDGSGETYRIGSVVIDNGGSGYTYAAAHIVTEEGSGAEISVNIGGSALESDQSTVEQLAVRYRGAIYSIVITNGGTGYTVNDKVTITGDGNGGCTAKITEVDDDGVIQKIEVVNYGEGYGYAEVHFTRANEADEETNTEAEAYAILSPFNGHGFDAPEELNGYRLAIYTLLRGNQDIIELGQDFRQFGIVANIKDIDSYEKTSTLEGLITFDIKVKLVNKTISQDLPLAKDDLVTIMINYREIRHRIISISDPVDGVYTLKVQQLAEQYNEISEYDSLTNYYIIKSDGSIGHATDFDGTQIEGDNYEITEVLSEPTVDKYSGNVLFVKNLTPITISATKLMSLRTYITF